MGYMISSHTTADAFEIMLREIKDYVRVVLHFDWVPLFSMSDNCEAIKTAILRVWPDIVLGQPVLIIAIN